MSKIKVTDDWLYQYMPVVDEALIRGIEDSTDYEYQFSEQFRGISGCCRACVDSAFHFIRNGGYPGLLYVYYHWT